MMKSTEVGKCDHLGIVKGPGLNPTTRRCLLPEIVMRPVVVIVPDVILEQPTELLVVEDDDVIEEFSTYVAHPAFSDAVLPRALVGSADGLDFDGANDMSDR